MKSLKDIPLRAAAAKEENQGLQRKAIFSGTPECRHQDSSTSHGEQKQIGILDTGWILLQITRLTDPPPK